MPLILKTKNQTKKKKIQKLNKKLTTNLIFQRIKMKKLITLTLKTKNQFKMKKIQKKQIIKIYKMNKKKYKIKPKSLMKKIMNKQKML